jgi:hypothetical protein
MRFYDVPMNLINERNLISYMKRNIFLSNICMYFNETNEDNQLTNSTGEKIFLEKLIDTHLVKKFFVFNESYVSLDCS